MKKHSSKRYIFHHISVLSFFFKKKLLLQIEKPLFQVLELIELGISPLIRILEMLFLWFEPLRLDQTRRSKIVSRATGRYAATSFDELLVCPRSSFVGVA